MSRIDDLASQLHENWRAEWRRANGNQPRPKTTTDQRWINIHRTNEVDIAATAFRDLPRDWQAENRASAEAALAIVKRLKQSQRPLNDSATIEEASALLHKNWLSRNRAWASAVQRLPYNRLPEDEKEKDRLVIRLAIHLLS